MRPECDWVAWFDADVFITNPLVHLRFWLAEDAHLIMTDHSAAINNGAFIVSAAPVR